MAGACGIPIFVFGSNLAGRHGAGAALFALKYHGAIFGRGVGRQGSSYAIPTKNGLLEVLPLCVIRDFVEEFLAYARKHRELLFSVTKIGCGLAGYKEEQIRPLFEGAPLNCLLPDGWRTVTWEP